jgi:hypothetical protein
MANGTIRFDDEGGVVRMTVTLDGPFDITSHAHRQVNMVINFLDQTNVALAEEAEATGQHTPPASLIQLPVAQAIQVVRG